MYKANKYLYAQVYQTIPFSLKWQSSWLGQAENKLKELEKAYYRGAREGALVEHQNYSVIK